MSLQFCTKCANVNLLLAQITRIMWLFPCFDVGVTGLHVSELMYAPTA